MVACLWLLVTAIGVENGLVVHRKGWLCTHSDHESIADRSCHIFFYHYIYCFCIDNFFKKIKNRRKEYIRENQYIKYFFSVSKT
jgi:hypothetical protein